MRKAIIKLFILLLLLCSVTALGETDIPPKPAWNGGSSIMLTSGTTILTTIKPTSAIHESTHPLPTKPIISTTTPKVFTTPPIIPTTTPIILTTQPIVSTKSVKTSILTTTPIVSTPTQIVSTTTHIVSTPPLPATTATPKASEPTKITTITSTLSTISYKESTSIADFIFSTTTSTTPPPQSFATPHVRTPLEERISHLACNFPPLPPGSKMWVGNETHELLLPKFTQNCKKRKKRKALAEKLLCAYDRVSWESEVDIQSGDVLLVRIDDSQVITINDTKQKEGAESILTVYQVNRHGYENCDKTEGDLLDITPLKIEDRKVVALYDKDLAEGLNLIIVTSDQWVQNHCARLKVFVKSDNCGDTVSCSNKGICYSNSSMEGYECQCCPGFIGPHCEELDACYNNPCLNNGICVDLTQGHTAGTYQCLCPYGYTGQRCEQETDPCTSMPCHHGAVCVANKTQFECLCPKGYSGHQCQHKQRHCELSTCKNGVCVEQNDGYKCYCNQGYTGENCDIIINACCSSPCKNGGRCFAANEVSYRCECVRGFTGEHCEDKVEMCIEHRCPEDRVCVDKGNNYTCNCFENLNMVEDKMNTCKMYTSPLAGFGDPMNEDNVHCMPGFCPYCWVWKNISICSCEPKTGKGLCNITRLTQLDKPEEEIREETKYDIHLAIHSDHYRNYEIAFAVFGVLLVGTIVLVICTKGVEPTLNWCVRCYTQCKLFVYRRASWCTWGKRVRKDSSCNNSVVFHSDWFSGKDKAPMATPARSIPALETKYSNLEFCEILSSPLMQ